MLLDYIFENQLFNQSNTNCNATKDIKMHSHFNFQLACLKQPANLVNYYRPFRCDAVMQIIYNLFQTILYTAKQIQCSF